MTSLALACRLGAATAPQSIPRRVRAILNKYGATLLLPGVSGAMRFGYQPGNYRESTGQTLAGVDQQVGLVVDAARSPGPELVTNGTGNSTDGWLNIWSGTATVENEKIKLTNTVGGFGGISRPITLVAGKTYLLSAEYTHVDGSGFVTVSSAANGTGTRLGASPQLSSTGKWQAVFTSSITSAYVCVSQGYTSTTGTVAYFDNISVRELPGIHASQSTSGFQPVLRNTAGIQSWRFDGTDDRLSLSSVPFQMADDHFVVLGLSSEDVYAERRPFFVRNGVTMFGITFGGSGQNTLAANWIDDAGLNCSVSSANAVHNDTNYAVSMRKAGNSKTLRRDGVQLGLNTVQLGTATLGAAVPFIGMENGVSRPFRGPIHGVIFGKGAITNSELLTLERFMATLQGRTL